MSKNGEFTRREEMLRRVSALPSATTPEEAAALHSAWQQGDRDAGLRLQNTAVKIAASLAMRQLRRDTGIAMDDYDDLLAEAMTEALTRLKDWDPAQGALSTYVAPALGFAMDHYTKTERARGTGDYRAPPILQATTVLAPDAEEEGPELTSYDSSLTYQDPPEGYEDPLDAMIKAEVKDVLIDAITGLTPWQQTVIHAAYGLTGQEEQSQQEIAAAYAVKQQSVSEALLRAQAALKKKIAQGPCKIAGLVHTSVRTSGKVDSGAPSRGEAKAKDWLAPKERARLKKVLRDTKEGAGYPKAAARPGRLSVTGTGMSDSEFWNKYRPRVRKETK